MQTFQNISNQIYPFITTPSIPCGQMGTNYTIDSNIFMRLPIIFCNSFQNINQIPSTYYNFPLQPEPQDMENYIIWCLELKKSHFNRLEIFKFIYLSYKNYNYIIWRHFLIIILEQFLHEYHSWVSFIKRTFIYYF